MELGFRLGFFSIWEWTTGDPVYSNIPSTAREMGYGSCLAVDAVHMAARENLGRKAKRNRRGEREAACVRNVKITIEIYCLGRHGLAFPLEFPILVCLDRVIEV